MIPLITVALTSEPSNLTYATGHQNRESESLNATANSSFGLDLPSLIVIAVVAGFVFALYKMYQKRLSLIREEEQLAAAELEAEIFGGPSKHINPDLLPDDIPKPNFESVNPILLSQVPGPTFSPTAEQPETVPSTPGDTAQPLVRAQSLPGSLISNDPTLADRVDSRCGWVFDVLRQAGLMEDIEGLENRHGLQKSAAIVRLKRGRKALLVQEMEPLSSTIHLLARFDMIIVAGGRSRAVVIKSLNEVVAEQF